MRRAASRAGNGLEWELGEEREGLDCLLGGLHFSAYPLQGLPGVVPGAWEWMKALHRQGVRVPFFLVLDLGRLFLEGERFPFRGPWEGEVGGGEREREARQFYEERVLYRRLSEAAFHRTFHLLRDLSEGTRGKALVLLLGTLLRPLSLRWPSRLPLPDPPLNFSGRELAERADPLEIAAARYRWEHRHRNPALFLEQVEWIHQWADEELDLNQRLQEEDFYEMEHADIFVSEGWNVQESLRIMVRRVKQVERLIPPLLLRPRAQRPWGGPQESILAAVGEYPVGGFAELTTRGAFESLLPSELVYWEPEAEVDLFRVRLMENELLYYLRDETSLRSLRRTFHFLLAEQDLDIPLDFHRPKIRNIVRALVLRLVRDLERALGDDEVVFHITFLDREADAKGIEAFCLLLAERIRQGRLTVERESPPLIWRNWVQRRREPDRQGTVIVLGAQERISPWMREEVEMGPLLRCLFVPVLFGSRLPPLEPDEKMIPLSLPPHAEVGTALGEVRDALVNRVI